MSKKEFESLKNEVKSLSKKVIELTKSNEKLIEENKGTKEIMHLLIKQVMDLKSEFGKGTKSISIPIEQIKEESKEIEISFKENYPFTIKDSTIQTKNVKDWVTVTSAQVFEEGKYSLTAKINETSNSGIMIGFANKENEFKDGDFIGGKDGEVAFHCLNGKIVDENIFNDLHDIDGLNSGDIVTLEFDVDEGILSIGINQEDKKIAFKKTPLLKESSLAISMNGTNKLTIEKCKRID